MRIYKNKSMEIWIFSWFRKQSLTIVFQIASFWLKDIVLHTDLIEMHKGERYCYLWPIVRLTMRYHQFLEFWLVDTWFLTHWRHHRAVTHLENVLQSNIRRGKKLGFQLLHKHPHEHSHKKRKGSLETRAGLPVFLYNLSSKNY